MTLREGHTMQSGLSDIQLCPTHVVLRLKILAGLGCFAELGGHCSWLVAVPSCALNIPHGGQDRAGKAEAVYACCSFVVLKVMCFMPRSIHARTSKWRGRCCNMALEGSLHVDKTKRHVRHCGMVLWGTFWNMTVFSYMWVFPGAFMWAKVYGVVARKPRGGG